MSWKAHVWLLECSTPVASVRATLERQVASTCWEASYCPQNECMTQSDLKDLWHEDNKEKDGSDKSSLTNAKLFSCGENSSFPLPLTETPRILQFFQNMY